MIDVSDTSSNRRDQIANFAEVLRNAKARRGVFEAVYFGPKPFKTIQEIAKFTNYNQKRVAEIACPLAREKLFEQFRVKVGGRRVTAYRKIRFVAANKVKILKLAQSYKKLGQYHTKTNPISLTKSRQRIVIRTPFLVRTKFIRIEDIKEFSRSGRVDSKRAPLAPTRLSELCIKKGFLRLLGENKVPKDWGGENNDIFTTRLTLFGKKRRAAFALKGPAKKGPLVPKMMGKNGDQIQRLFDTPAEVFFVQYEGEVKESIFKLMEDLARAKAIFGNCIYWGVIDEVATQRLRYAYPRIFHK